MFEALLEKILQSKLGRFLSGIDEKNLKVGVWSGDVEILNVSLKASVFDLFHFPLNLVFSHIGKISLKIPWKSLSSAPVEVFIEDVLAVVSPKDEKDWSFTDYNKFSQRLALLDEYAAEVLEKLTLREQFIEKKEEAKKESGYMDKVALKVLDNLQITIKGIHLRFESPRIEHRFSFGVTLDSLSVHTTNQKWEKMFMDRSDPQNAALPNHKILILNNFSIYWNSGEKRYFGEEKNPSEILASLKSLIKTDKEIKGMDNIINIKAQLKSIQNSKSKEGPEFWFSLNMDNLDTLVRKNQISDMIRLGSFGNRFKNAFEANKLKTLKENPSPLANKPIFLKYMVLYRSSDQTSSTFPQKDWLLFTEILTTTPMDLLYDWTKQVVRDIHKDQNLKKMEKQRTKKGFWGWGGEKALSEDEKKELEGFYEKNFSDEVIVVPLAKAKDQAFVDLEFELILDSGSLSLIQEKAPGSERKTILMQFQGLWGDFKKREANKEVKFELKEMVLEAVLADRGSEVYRQRLFSKADFPSKKQKKESVFLELRFEDNPLANLKLPENEPKIDYSLDLDIGSNKLVYDPKAIRWLRRFFDIEVEDQEIVEKAMKEIDKLNQNTQEAIRQKVQTLPIIKLNLKMQSPYLIIPLRLLDRKDSQAIWFVNFGEFSLETDSKALKSAKDSEDRLYDSFNVRLEDTQAVYLDSMNALRSFIVEGKSDNAVPLVKNIEILANLRTLNKRLKNIVSEKPETLLDVRMSGVELDFNKKSVVELLFLKSHFAREDKENFESKLISRQKLEQTAVKKGIVMKKSSLFKAWSEFFAILANGKIYLFDKADDLNSSSAISIYNAVVGISKEEKSCLYVIDFISSLSYYLK